MDLQARAWGAVRFFGAVAALTGCGAGVSPGTPPATPACIKNSTATAQVPVLLTADAPMGALDFLSVAIQSITLTDACGATATLYSGSPQNTQAGYPEVEFLHVNGSSEPLTVATVPQATYVAATVTTTSSTLGFLYPVNQFDGSRRTTNPTPALTELDAPLSISASGNAMEFSLLIPAPINIAAAAGPIGSYAPAFTPIFYARYFVPAAAPLNDREGLTSIRGLTQSASATEITLGNSMALPLTLAVDSKTVLQGIGNVAAIPQNVPASVDAVIRADGSLYASRIQVEDAATRGSWVGPLVMTYKTGTYEFIAPDWWMVPTDPGTTSNLFPFTFQFTPNTNYQRQGSAVDLTDLPFVPRFAAFSDTAVGQGLAIDWLQEQMFGNQPITEADSAVLIPRSFSGTITAVSHQSNYTTYTLGLETYDTMTTVSGVTSITAYSNAGTQMEDGDLAVGDAVNLHGFLFVDGGVPRLVCDQTRLQRKP